MRDAQLIPNQGTWRQVVMNIRALLGLLLAASLLPITVACMIVAQEPTLHGAEAAAAYASFLALFTVPISFVIGLPLLSWYKAKRWQAWYHFAIGGALLGLLPLGVMAFFGEVPVHLPFLLQLVGAGSAIVLWVVVGRAPTKRE